MDDVQVDFQDVMGIMNDTCIAGNRKQEAETNKITYLDKKTGWQCSFSVIESHKKGQLIGQPKRLSLHNFFNRKISDAHKRDIREYVSERRHEIGRRERHKEFLLVKD